jgi:uncharacterized protein YodC (DUF2158 family)
MRSKFVVGQVVKVKGQGLRMTIERVREGQIECDVDCVWFDDNDILHRATFDDRILEFVDDE